MLNKKKKFQSQNSWRDPVEDWFSRNIDIERRTVMFGNYDGNDDNDEGNWVHDRSVDKIIKALYLLENQNNDPITIIWNSDGGIWEAGMALYDYIVNLKSSVTMICYGRVRSMGSIVIQACDKRILSPNCKFLMHYGTMGIEGHSKDVIANVEEEVKDHTRMEDIYLAKIKEKHPRYKRKTLQSLITYDKYLTPKETIELGLADEVL